MVRGADRSDLRLVLMADWLEELLDYSRATLSGGEGQVVKTLSAPVPVWYFAAVWKFQDLKRLARLRY